MKNKLLLLSAIMGITLFAAISDASAATDPTFEVGYSSFATKGVVCSTGSVTQINAVRPVGFGAQVAGYRISNDDSSNAVWLGRVNVSSATTTAAMRLAKGEKLGPGANATWMTGKSYLQTTASLVPIYCLAADAATSGVELTLNWFGY